MNADSMLNTKCTPLLPLKWGAWSIACYAALALLALVTPARANLVINGSFETTTLTGVGQVQLNPASPDVTGWTRTNSTSCPLCFLYFPGTQNAQITDQFGPNDFQLWQGITSTIPNTSPAGGNFLVVDGAPAYRASFFQ